MNKKKLSQYRLTGSIHTLSLKVSGTVEVPETAKDCVESCIHSERGHIHSNLKINPNKMNGEIYSFSQFNKTMEDIYDSMDIKEYRLMRVDMPLDSFDQEHYLKYAKLNKYLISLMAVTYSVKNCYKSVNLFSQKQLSIAVKNEYMELENYDKKAESGGKAPAKARLEIRSKAWKDNDYQKEFCERWVNRWNKALENRDEVTKRYNDELEKIYLEGKDSFPVQFRSLTDFLIQYSDCIFTKRQMIDLLERFPEVKNAKNRAENHKKRYGIEYFSDSDIKAAVKEIQRATRSYFEK